MCGHKAGARRTQRTHAWKRGQRRTILAAAATLSPSLLPFMIWLPEESREVKTCELAIKTFCFMNLKKMHFATSGMLSVYAGVISGLAVLGRLHAGSSENVKQECPARVCKSVQQKCQARSSKSVKKGCQERVSNKECPVRVSCQESSKECPARVSFQECPARVSGKSLQQKCQARVSRKSVNKECPARVSSKSVQQVSPIRVPRKQFLSRVSKRVSGKNVPQGCLTRVSCKGVQYKSSQTWEHSGSWVLSGLFPKREPHSKLFGKSKQNQFFLPLKAVPIDCWTS